MNDEQVRMGGQQVNGHGGDNLPLKCSIGQAAGSNWQRGMWSIQDQSIKARRSQGLSR